MMKGRFDRLMSCGVLGAFAFAVACGGGASAEPGAGGQAGQSRAGAAPAAGGDAGASDVGSTGGAIKGGSTNGGALNGGSASGGVSVAGDGAGGASSSEGGAGGAPGASTNRVLMLVANDGFYFQEYYDPRVSLEAAGFAIDVASGALGQATPHNGSYDGRFTGVGAEVIAPISDTLAVSLLSSADYDALVLVGGWGAARYYYGYPGTFVDSSWQPVAEQAGAVNGLIDEFIAERKYILAICNGVSVLAWARVEDEQGSVSPLSGRHVRAPWSSAPAQSDYLGEAYGTSWAIDQACAWQPSSGSNCFRLGKFASDNGAIVPNPYDSVPDVVDANDTARRDAVAEDGRFITAQDNFAARAGAQLLAQRLSQ